MAYMATRLTQYPINAILDEDVVDGTLAAGNKAVLLTGLQYLDPAVISGLEAFAKQGGVVLVTADCNITVAGADKLDVMPEALWKKAQEELKKSLRELKEMDIKKDQFISIAAHELKTPLTSIHGFSQLLQNRKVANDFTKRNRASAYAFLGIATTVFFWATHPVMPSPTRNCTCPICLGCGE